MALPISWLVVTEELYGGENKMRVFSNCDQATNYVRDCTRNDTRLDYAVYKVVGGTPTERLSDIVVYGPDE